MSNKRDIHVVPHKEGWATRREGSSRALGIHRTQTDAIDSGRSQARKDRVELVTHRKDGRIRDSDSYGNDPHPPKDRKH
ncbi:DUF2188 domain-containing protein [Guyparkeria sp. SCN-R1]|uniref:DUF2188 domain-containing protein n=1 Tax=Guyparkeria sp. SCN-R1 TaxID=2341113 RepID=UPI000F648FB6|nr:DUF2188 domain-containing protein [Guyparkeria sp. SCN-R1]RRQ23197.1 DUF2188 domain-containing protein [Guyparkeria sp. SCN-R1]